jgi:hypothetical protein
MIYIAYTCGSRPYLVAWKHLEELDFFSFFQGFGHFLFKKNIYNIGDRKWQSNLSEELIKSSLQHNKSLQ